jgi:nucleolar complex protein 2
MLSERIIFTEFMLLLFFKLKEFTKKCKNSNYCKVIKGLLDKVQENSKFVEEKRNKATFSLKDKKAVDLWIEKNKETGTPLSQWYSRYKIARERELLLEASNKDHVCFCF